jgi:hypothetical protein
MSAATAEQVDPLVDRLDRITQMFELALSPQLQAARAALRENAVDAAILDAGGGNWKPAARLLSEVEGATGKKKRAIHGHINALLERGFLEKQGAGRTTEYRTSAVL